MFTKEGKISKRNYLVIFLQHAKSRILYGLAGGFARFWALNICTPLHPYHIKLDLTDAQKVTQVQQVEDRHF